MTAALDFLSDAAREAIAQLVEETVERKLAERQAEEDRSGSISRYMSVPEAAEHLRCKRQRVDDLLSSGRLTRVKEGRRTLLLREEVERYLTTNGRR